MALERLVSNKYFKGEYTQEEIRALFSQDTEIAMGEIIIYNDSLNPTIYFLDELGNLQYIQKIPYEEGGITDEFISEMRSLKSDVNDLQITVINNKEELELEIAGLRLKIEELEEIGGSNVSPEILDKINENSENIVKLNEKDEEFEKRLISLENKMFLLEDIDDEIAKLKETDIELRTQVDTLSLKDVELNVKIKDLSEEVSENEYLHSMGLNILNENIKKLDERLSVVEEGGVDVDFTEIEDKINTTTENINSLSATTISIDERLTSIEEGNVDIDLSEIEGDITKIKEDITSLNNNVTLLGDDVFTMSNNIIEINEKINSIEESGISSVNEKIIALENKDIELTKKDNELSASISLLKNNDITTLNTKVRNLESKSDDIEERVIELEKIDLTPLENNIKSLEDHNIVIDGKIEELYTETSNLTAFLDVLKEEVEENELVHSVGLNVLNKEIKDLKTVVENIESGEIIIDLTEIEKRIGDVEDDVKGIDDRVKLIEDGNVDVDFTEIENRISDIETISETNKNNIVSINEEIIGLNTRVETLENVEPIDLTEIENDITSLKEDNETFSNEIISIKNFDENIAKTVTSLNSVANKALNSANESIKSITPNRNTYTSISTNISERIATLEVIANVLDIHSSSEDNDGLASSFDVKNEIESLTNTVNNYNVNGKLISENPIIGTDDLNVGDEYLSKKPEETQNIMPNDELTLAIAKLEHKLDTIIQIFSTAINEINNRLNLLDGE